MPFEIKAEFNARDLIRKLSQFEEKVVKRVTRQAITHGCKSMVKMARNMVPVRKTFELEKRLVGPLIADKVKTEDVKIVKKQFAGEVVKYKIVKQNRFNKKISVSVRDDRGKTKLGYLGGQLKKSLGYRIKVYRDTGVVIGVVGPRRGYRISVGVRSRGPNKGKPVFINPVNYAHLVELGTRRTAAQPFLRPAVQGGIQDLLSMLRFGIERAIEEVARAA